GIGQVFPSAYRPDRERTISTKISITPPLTDKEQGPCFLEQEGASSRFLVGLGRGVGPRYTHAMRNERETVASERYMCRDAALRLGDKPAMWYPVIRIRLAEETIGAFHLRSLSLF